MTAAPSLSRSSPSAAEAVQRCAGPLGPLFAASDAIAEEGGPDGQGDQVNDEGFGAGVEINIGGEQREPRCGRQDGSEAMHQNSHSSRYHTDAGHALGTVAA